jgi:hypothetical protein
MLLAGVSSSRDLIMHGRFGGLEAGHVVIALDPEPAQEAFALAHENRRHDEVEIVEEPGFPVLGMGGSGE